MKNLSIIGLILLGLAVLIWFVLPEFQVEDIFRPSSLMGILAGVGLGLMIGGIVGYSSKGMAIKEKERQAEIDRLQKEKEELQRQTEIIAQQQNRDNSRII